MLNWLLARLNEPSTHAAVASIAAGVASATPAGSVYHLAALALVGLFGGVAAVKAG